MSARGFGWLAAVSTVLAAGCASPAPPPPEIYSRGDEPAPAAERPAPRPTSETVSLVDRLRVDSDYRPAPTGGEAVTSWVQFAPGAYIAQGWPYGDVFRLSWPAPYCSSVVSMMEPVVACPPRPCATRYYRPRTFGPRCAK